MIRDVRVARDVFSRAHDRFGESRSVEGAPSEYDFVGGPLAAAILAFRDFENLAYDLVSTVRTYTIVDLFFGAVTFVVEAGDLDDDPDYWSTIGDEPW